MRDNEKISYQILKTATISQENLQEGAPVMLYLRINSDRISWHYSFNLFFVYNFFIAMYARAFCAFIWRVSNNIFIK